MATCLPCLQTWQKYVATCSVKERVEEHLPLKEVRWYLINSGLWYGMEQALQENIGFGDKYE